MGNIRGDSHNSLTNEVFHHADQRHPTMVTINFSFQPGMSLQQMIGFEIAGRVWGAYLKDPTTVNIHVGTSNSLPSGVLGGALPGFKTGVAHQDFEVSGLRTYLEEDDTSSDDQSALNTIKNRAHYAQFNQYNSSGQIAGKQWVDGTSVSLTRANAKSLRISLDNEAAIDGYIVMNNNVRNAIGQLVPWNYSYASTTVPTDTIDFVSVAIHEIGHVFGFVSGVNRPWKISPTSADTNAFTNSLLERINESTPLDLLRTSQFYYQCGGRFYG